MKLRFILLHFWLPYGVVTCGLRLVAYLTADSKQDNLVDSDHFL